MNEKKYYIAYGSNLSVEQMAQRCPDARVVGQAVLEDWELAFHGCATILPNKGKNTPVLVWEISAGDEKNLDIYEGYPNFYPAGSCRRRTAPEFYPPSRLHSGHTCR